MGAVKRLAEELGILGHEKTYYLSLSDLGNIVNGNRITFLGEFGEIINLEAKK